MAQLVKIVKEVGVVGFYSDTPESPEHFTTEAVEVLSYGKGAWVSLNGLFNAYVLREIADTMDKADDFAKSLKESSK